MTTEAIQPLRPGCVAQSVERVWPGAQWTATSLDDGMTNRNYRVVVTPFEGPSMTVVVQEQLPPDMATSIGILRHNQMTIWPQAYSWGLAPEMIAVFEDIGTVVMEFVDGTRMADFDDRELAIRLTARALHDLHQRTAGSRMSGLVADAFDGTYWMFDQILEATPAKAAEFQWGMDMLDRIKAARGAYQRCLLHSDPSAVNIFVAPDRSHVVLIDWEYIGSGDPYYELAYFAERVELSESEESLMLRTYDPTMDDVSRAAVIAYRFIAMLRDALWAVRAGMLGFLDFDHREYEAFCRNRMNGTYADPRFHAALALLEAASHQPASTS